VSLTDLPMPILFAIFLLLFVLLGIYPAWKRTATRIRRFLSEQQNQLGLGLPDPGSKEPPAATVADSRDLNDFEVFILRQLAWSGGKGLSRRQLVEQLHFEPALVKQTLASLLDRGLVGIGLPTLFGLRFTLSTAGHAYAVERGYILRAH